MNPLRFYLWRSKASYLLSLERGTNDIYVRAYDRAGNFSEAKKRLSIVAPLFQIVEGEGLRISEIVTIPWVGLWLIIVCLGAFNRIFCLQSEKMV